MNLRATTAKQRLKTQWESQSRFHDLGSKQVLGEVIRRAKAKPGSSVLLDLDSTLYEVQPRTFKIIEEWLNSDESRPFDDVRAAFLEANSKFSQIGYSQIGYSLKDTFQNHGLDVAANERALKSAKAFWSERFFSSKYVGYDLPYEGAAQFTRELENVGARIVYLTGRDEPGMGEGTRDALKRDGFAWGSAKTHLLLKPEFDMPDIEHKREASKFVHQYEPGLIASFENEPVNLVALYDEFPHAMHVFVDTVCSDRAAEPRAGLYRVTEFN